MDWWQTLIVATAPALVTGAGLLYQQRRADTRDHERRRDEADERDKERQHAVSITWLEDRRAAHTEAWAALEAYRKWFHTITVLSKPEGEDGNLRFLPDDRIPAEMVSARDRSLAAVSVLQLLAGDEALDHAAAAHNEMVELHDMIDMFKFIPANADDVDRDTRLALHQYLRAARRDLRTTEG